MTHTNSTLENGCGQAVCYRGRLCVRSVLVRGRLPAGLAALQDHGGIQQGVSGLVPATQSAVGVRLEGTDRVP